MRKYVFKKFWKRAVVALFDFVGDVLLFPIKLFSQKNFTPNKILVVRLDQVGDVIQALPFFSSLRKKYPTAKIYALCARATEFLLNNNPDVDGVFTVEGSWFYREKHFSDAEMHAVSKAIKKEGIDTAYDLRGDLRNILFLFFTGIKHRIGYGCTGGGFLLTHELPYVRDEHEMDKNLKLIGEKAQDDLRINFPVSSHDEAAASAITNNFAGKKIIVHPFTRAASKMWGVDKFAELVRRIADAGGNIKIYIIGGPEDVPLLDEFQMHPKVIRCAGKHPYGTTMGLIKRADVFIGNDSGPQYFAAYSGLKTAVVYGYTVNYKRWMPKVRAENFIGISEPVKCGPCESSECVNKKGKHECMDVITVDMVYEKVKDWLS
jgi:ADP-heptose:LPS heptosyltransferase